MRILKIVYLVLFIACFASCIPTKRLTYLQESDTAIDSIKPIRKINKLYRLQVNDLVSVRIKALDQDRVGVFNPVTSSEINATGEERLYYDGFVVDIHGEIRVPTLGNVKVLGLTVEEARLKIEKKLREDFFREDAVLFVTVKLAGIRYTINGEIGSPGSNIVYRDQLSIMEAIANSGDITITGDRENVVIVRQYPLGQKVHHIDLTKIEAMNSPYYFVQPNDLILINPLPQKSFGTGTDGLQSFTTIVSVTSALVTALLLFTRL
ncbi:polysaccharide export outer membrane protein [unidentified eubacterium SCB49]|nr:polysaccharide export outer membrane protein [unidentified eubacterium SCB49]